MLEARRADTGRVVRRILITVAWVCCGLVLASFALFVRDQLKSGSAHQANLISTATTTPAAPAPHPPGQPRRFILDARHDLVSPFASIVASDNNWVNQIVPDVFALLVYGGGLGFLARYSSGRA